MKKGREQGYKTKNSKLCNEAFLFSHFQDSFPVENQPIKSKYGCEEIRSNHLRRFLLAIAEIITRVH
jgi:hypothetical protein